MLLAFGVTLTNMLTQHCPKEYTKGLLGISGKHVDWLKMCPNNKFTGVLSEMDSAMENYGMTQIKDEVWFCGGKSFGNDEDHDQSKSCLILSLTDGQWTTLEFKMNLPRLKPVVFAEGGKVIVMGGTTSDINSRTGCRDTQEDFDTNNQSLGWVVEPIEERNTCQISSQIVTVDCH